MQEFAPQTNYESLMLFMKQLWTLLNFGSSTFSMACIYTINFVVNDSNQIVICHDNQVNTYAGDKLTKSQKQCMWVCHVERAWKPIGDVAFMLGLKVNYNNNTIQPTIKKFDMVNQFCTKKKFCK